MNSVINRQRSRRRLAALTFLSNISLDGTHQDTNLGRYYDRKRTIKGEKENFSNEASHLPSPSVKISNSHVRDTLCQTAAHVITEPARKDSSERIALDEAADRTTVLKRLNSHGYSLSEKRPCFSSSESVGPLGSGLLHKKHNLSGTLSEVSGSTNKEIKDLNPSSISKVKDERLVFVTKHKTPLHIFSALPFVRHCKPDFNPRDTIRKRHISGNRPTSVVSVSTDPAHILGITCFEDATEISFSDLLVPSRHFHRSKRHYSENIDGGIVSGQAAEVVPEKPIPSFPHPAIARCFSYEPATHRATAHYIPYGQHDQREEKSSASQVHSNDFYVPNLLDDPELRAGKHRKLLRFPSYLTSLTDYTKPFELKKELNDKFKEKFPHVNLTLSKLRSLKRELLKVAHHECDVDLLTVAQSYVYFEKMIQKSCVNKPNRKLIAGACLLLSAKMNDVKGEALTGLIDKIEAVFRLNRKELLSWELATMVALEFGLHVPVWQVNPHFQRLVFES